MADVDIKTRAPSVTRAEAIAKSFRARPVYQDGVLIGNWVEDKIECPANKNMYFPPKEIIDYDTMKPNLRRDDFRTNKFNSCKGGIQEAMTQEAYEACGNYCTTNDLVYNHLPRPLCGQVLRYYKRCKHAWYPQPDLAQCFGNATEWGLRKYKQHEWACTDVSDYASSLFNDTYIPPKPEEYLQRSERLAKNTKFTRQFQYSMCKPIVKKQKK